MDARSRSLRKYGLTPADYDELVETQNVWGTLTRPRLGDVREPVESLAHPADSEECPCSGRCASWRSGVCSGSCCFVVVQLSSRSWRSSCFDISSPCYVGRQVAAS